MSAVVWMNGVVVAPEDAKVSVFDRGFLYGDSVYETVRVHRGVAFLAEAHAERLAGSAARIAWTLPWSAVEVLRAVDAAVAAAKLSEASLRVIATRGSGPLGLDPGLAKTPLLIVMVDVLPALPRDWYELGRAAWLVAARGRSVDPLAKTGSYMHSVLALSEAKSRGADDAIMIDADGQVTESTVANVFAHLDDGWVTPPLAAGILSGITRKTLLEVGPAGGVAIRERPIGVAELRRAREILLSSSVRELIPVTRLDAAPVGDGRVGPGTRALQALYRARVESYGRAALEAGRADPRVRSTDGEAAPATPLATNDEPAARPAGDDALAVLRNKLRRAEKEREHLEKELRAARQKLERLPEFEAANQRLSAMVERLRELRVRERAPVPQPVLRDEATQPVVEAPKRHRARHNKEQARVGVFVDVANLAGAARRAYGRNVDYRRLLASVVGGRRLVLAHAYAIDKGADFSAFAQALRDVGYRVFKKTPKTFADGSVKADWDVGIAVDVMRSYGALDVVVLASGDGDYLPLVAALRGAGLQVEAAAFSARAAIDLKSGVDRFIDLGEEVLE